MPARIKHDICFDVESIQRIGSFLINDFDKYQTLKKVKTISFIFNVVNFFRFPAIKGHPENAKLQWLIRLRWGAISLFFLMAGPGYFYGTLSRTNFIIFVGVIGLLISFNLLSHLTAAGVKAKVSPLVIGFQLAFDLAVLCVLLLLSGGFANPFVALFLINAGLGGVLIRGRNSWPFVVLCHAFMVALQIEYATNNLNLSHQAFWFFVFASHVLILSAWLVMRSVGNYLEEHFEDLTQSRIQYEKQDRLRAIGALAAGFSHEFASPLNAAKLRLDRLERALSKIELSKSWTSEAIENIIEIKESVRTCESVIHAMNASQLDVRDHQLKLVQVNEFLKDVTDSWLEGHNQAQLKVLSTIETQILVSPINLAQVIFNLLDNAFESEPSGEIQLILKKESQRIILSVEDEGPGFTNSVLQRKGEPFVTTKINGTGLGLYVSEIFAQSLGGTLSISNKSQSGGAVVSLNWPLLQDKTGGPQ